jgi:Flp pilus assembly pilin Flp
MGFAHVYFVSFMAALSERLAQAHRRAQAGQGLVEYALIIGMIAIAAIVVLGLVSGKVQATFSAISNSLLPTPTP